MPPERGLFESQRVSVSVSKRRNGGFCAPVSASKISVPDSDVRDRFDDDCVGGWQFGPFPLHHPVLPNRRNRRRSLSGTGRIRPLAISKQLASKAQFNGVGRLRTYISFTHSAF